MRFFLIFIFIIFSYSTDMQILSKHFEYNQTANIAKFIGDVNVTKESDNILCNTLYVYTSKDKKLNKLIANGNVRFIVKDNNSTYKGNSNKLTYIAPKQLFIFVGNVHITKLEDNQQLFGDKVIIDKKNGTANIVGKKNEPLKFIIKVNE